MKTQLEAFTQAMRPFIPLDKELPQDSQQVICKDQTGTDRWATYYTGLGFIREPGLDGPSRGFWIKNVTHWKPYNS